jgi:CitMHS family citrate-Mg2+:H+ or citrate-Ca2+:H+ symporter
MNDMVVGILGLAAIAATVISLTRSRMLPAMAFILWPSLLALAMVAGGRCGFADIEAMIKAGFASTSPTAALFVFSVLFFGIMTDAGMFDVLIKKLMELMGDNVVGVAMVTAIMALAAHLDGGGASTFCIVIPAMFPVYMRMHMRKTTLLRIAILPMGIMNLLPWTGSTVRTATVLGIEVSSVWRTLLPIQILGILLSLSHALLAGLQEKARGAGLHGRLAKTEGEIEIGDGDYIFEIRQLTRPKMFLFNICLTAAVIVLLVWGVFPSYFPFMIGTGIALLQTIRHCSK